MKDIEQYKGWEFQPESVRLDHSDLGWLSAFIFLRPRTLSPYPDIATAKGVLEILLTSGLVEVGYLQTTRQPLVDTDGVYYFVFKPFLKVKHRDWLFAFRPHGGSFEKRSQEEHDLTAKFLEALERRVPMKVVYMAKEN